MNTKRIFKIFGADEILAEEKFYRYISKKKIVVFVPEDYADKVMIDMANAGAGKIGNYETCSFRSEGTGTFKPVKGSAPFAGKKNILNYVKETRIEMECESDKLNIILDTMLKTHPYEEIVYEICEFRKRDITHSGMIIYLKKKIKQMELLKRLNSKITEIDSDTDAAIRKIAFTTETEDLNLIDSARYINCDCIISKSNKNYKLSKIY